MVFFKKFVLLSALLTLTIPAVQAKPASTKHGFNQHHKTINVSVHHRSKMPKHTKYIVVAGITYGVINNVYYRKNGNRYIRTNKPHMPRR